jgi:hypothetical protein
MPELFDALGRVIESSVFAADRKSIHEDGLRRYEHSPTAAERRRMACAATSRVLRNARAEQVGAKIAF